MSKLGTTEKTKLNNSMSAMQDAAGGTLLGKIDTAFATGVVTVSAAQINASAISISTGETGINGFFVQRYTSGSQISDLKVVNSGSILDVTAGSGSPLATGDVVYWQTF